MRRFGLRGIAVLYLVAVLLGPVAMVFYRAFAHGLHPLWSSLSDPNKGRMVKIEQAVGATTSG
jgi:ABC-type sulfate transport system permease subunit